MFKKPVFCCSASLACCEGVGHILCRQSAKPIHFPPTTVELSAGTARRRRRRHSAAGPDAHRGRSPPPHPTPQGGLSPPRSLPAPPWQVARCMDPNSSACPGRRPFLRCDPGPRRLPTPCSGFEGAARCRLRWVKGARRGGAPGLPYLGARCPHPDPRGRRTAPPR